MTRGLTAAGALAAAAGLTAAAAATSASDEARIAAGSFGTGAVLLLGLAVRFAWNRLIVGAVAALGVSYASSLTGRGLDLGAAAAGAGLLLVAELAHWSIESRRLAGAEPAVQRERAAALAGAAIGAAAVGTLVLGFSVIPARGGYALEALGAAGAAGVMLVAALALRRRPR